MQLFLCALPQKKIKEAHEEGKVLHERGQLLHAQGKYEEALVLCQHIDLADEACEIYYSFAKLHMQVERFESAFRECSAGLNIHPSAKVVVLILKIILCMILHILYHYGYLCSPEKIMPYALRCPFKFIRIIMYYVK